MPPIESAGTILSVGSPAKQVLLQLLQPKLQFLSDVSPPDKPWDVHRAESSDVAEILAGGVDRHQRQSARMVECSRSLEFGWVLESTETGEVRLRLKQAWFCRVRHCPVCQWRRSLMWVARFHQAFPRIYADYPRMRYALLTLTVRNCPVADLRQTLKVMNSAWKRITERKIWPAVGFVRSLEVTKGQDGTAHPHFHCLLALEPGYFVGRRYLSTAKWAGLWADALRVDYIPVCDVRLVKPKLAAVGSEVSSSVALLSAISETVKYQVKPADMMADSEWFLTLVDQLRNSRAVALGGIFREYLADDDGEQGDFIGESEDGKENSGGVCFGWRENMRRYVKK
jgi:plasmid rolling circle replication initiator protein Rep